MKAEYDFYQSPVPKGSNRKPGLHARIVPGGTVDSNLLAKEIHEACSLTIGDVEATILMLGKVMVQNLKEGKRIHIKGLGYFEMTLQCPQITDAKEIRAESVRFKSLAFRPEVALKKELSTTKFVRVTRKRHSKEYATNKIEELLTGFYAGHETLSRLDFQQLCGFTKGTASRRLAELVKAGKLKKEGLYRFPVYVPMKGCFGK